MAPVERIVTPATSEARVLVRILVDLLADFIVDLIVSLFFILFRTFLHWPSTVVRL